ncbi:MAG: DUF935 family protein [Magnetococcales bacterium]|nr:DUF935 family protein [Magnetococcales bacterium]
MSAEQVKFKELAASTGELDVTRRVMGEMGTVLPGDDILVSKSGGNYGLYEDILRDDQVASTLQQRRLAIIARPWVVDPGNDDALSGKAADFLKRQLERISWDTITDQMLYGVFFGFAVAECMWGRQDNQVVLTDVRVRHLARFAFGDDGGLRLRTPDNPVVGEPLPDRKFWVFRTGAFHGDDPYGRGLAHHLYWPVFIKRGGLRAWLQMQDKFGAPTALGVYPVNAGEAEKRDLLRILEAMHSQAGIIIPEGMRVELLESSRGGGVGNAELYDRMNDAIAKVVLSQTLTTEAAGGQYKGDVHKAVRNEVVKADADMICESFNRGPAVWLTEWNFPGAAPPRLRREIQEPEDLDARSAREERLFRIGYRPTLKQVKETYGGEWEEVPGVSSDSDRPVGASFAEASSPDPEEDVAVADQSVADAAASMGLESVQTMVEPWLKAIMQRLKQAESLEDALRRMSDLYAGLATDDLEETLARQMFVAEMISRSAGRD